MLLGRYNNEDISKNSGHPEIFSDCQSFFLIFAVLVCQQVDFSNNLASKFLISALYFLDVLCSLLSYLFCFCPGLFRFLFFAYLHFLLLFLHSLFFFIFSAAVSREAPQFGQKLPFFTLISFPHLGQNITSLLLFFIIFILLHCFSFLLWLFHFHSFYTTPCGVISFTVCCLIRTDAYTIIFLTVQFFQSYLCGFAFDRQRLCIFHVL